jgi:nucleotide-binding universal stress UspA family protein
LTVNQEALTELGNLAIEISTADITTDVPLKPIIKFGNPSNQILETAEEEEVDLIVMGSHGHGFVAGALLGSVSQRVLHQADCPVLIVK